jgi:hypothetical protein
LACGKVKRQAFVLVLLNLFLIKEVYDSINGIQRVYTLGSGLDDQDSRVRFLVGAGNFSLYHHIQNSS